MYKKLLMVFKICFVFLFCIGFAQAAEVKLQSGLMMPDAKNISAFTLEQQMDQQGKKTIAPFTNDDLKNHYTLLFYGFTNCPMLCPTTMANLANAYAQLQQEHIQPLPQVVFVSVDSGRDSAEKVHAFATTFNPHFIGVRTDDQKTLIRMTHEMNSMFQIVKLPAGTTQDKDQSANYTVDHTGDILVLNPKGQLIAMLTMPHTAANIVADYKTILAHENQTSGFLAKIASWF